jgi:hypothetical protein
MWIKRTNKASLINDFEKKESDIEDLSTVIVSSPVVVVYVDGVGLCLWTAVTKGLLFIPQMVYEHGQPWWNDIDRRKPNGMSMVE